MTLQSPDWGDRKKRFKRGSGRLGTSPQRNEPADALRDEEIDPADFWDPEEFGIRRPGPKPSRQ
jgi:hypothetical protein